MASEKRRNVDIAKLRRKGFEVVIPDTHKTTDFIVTIVGPDETPYRGGRWRVSVHLPSDYPYRSPSVGFVDRIYHPNVDERSGSICLDVINQTWSPMYDLSNIFESFLPQLLRYPNPASPLNPSAAGLLVADPLAYERRVREHMDANAWKERGVSLDASPTSIAAVSEVVDSAAAHHRSVGAEARSSQCARPSPLSASESCPADTPKPTALCPGAAPEVPLTSAGAMHQMDVDGDCADVDDSLSDASDLSDL